MCQWRSNRLRFKRCSFAAGASSASQSAERCLDHGALAGPLKCQYRESPNRKKCNSKTASAIQARRSNMESRCGRKSCSWANVGPA